MMGSDYCAPRRLSPWRMLSADTTRMLLRADEARIHWRDPRTLRYTTEHRARKAKSQRRIGSGRSEREDPIMLHIHYFITRKASMNDAEFHRYWRETHGTLA